jgi:hypothetical protein
MTSLRRRMPREEKCRVGLDGGAEGARWYGFSASHGQSDSAF